MNNLLARNLIVAVDVIDEGGKKFFVEFRTFAFDLAFDCLHGAFVVTAEEYSVHGQS